MSYVEKLLDKAALKCDRPSYRALAERMGVTSASLSQFKLGQVPMPEERIVQAAKIAGEDPDIWLLIVKAEQTHGDVAKSWQRLARKLGAAAAIVLMLSAVSLPSQAHGFVESAETGNPSIHYAKCVTFACPARGSAMNRPPCWPENGPCPNGCAAALHSREVYNHVDLTGPRAGWRLRGRDLVSPSGIRLSPERAEGLAWRQANEDRRDAARRRNATKSKPKPQRVKVVVVELALYLENGLAAG